MKRVFRALEVLFLAVLTLVAIGPVVGQCCGPTPAPAATVYRWEGWPDDPAQVALMDGKRQVGIWVVAQRAYYPRLGRGRWGVAGRPPIAPPGQARSSRCDCDPTCPCNADECKCNRLSGRCCRDCSCEKDPRAADSRVADWVTSGVETDKVGRGPAYRRRGREITRQEAFQVVQGKGCPTTRSGCA
jgi:hypothetical protein